MTENRELTSEEAEKYFKSELENSPPDVRERYSVIYFEERIKSAKNGNGRPLPIDLEKRENFLRIAKNANSVEEAKTLVKIDRDWEAATRANKGRPPIGGAPDD